MYVKVENGELAQYPYTKAQLRNENPNTSFPKGVSDDALEEWGVYKVSFPAPPDHDPKTQNCDANGTPTLEGGSWVMGWTVTDKTAEERTAYDNAIAGEKRAYRDQLISETDWWASSDLTMTAEQTAYRQALRDITTHANWPHLEESDWPVKP